MGPTWGQGSVLQVSVLSVLGMASLTVRTTDVVTSAKVKSELRCWGLGVEREGTVPWEHICFIISRSRILQ